MNVLIDRVDTYRYENVYELDFRLQKTLTIGPVEVIVAAELFNVANANTVLQSAQWVGTYVGPGEDAAGRPLPPTYTPDPYFGRIAQIQSPRIVRLGVQVNF